MYGGAERILGNLLKERRHDIVLATKVHGRVGEGVNDGGQSRYHIFKAVEDSLRRLKTDYLDLYQVHRFDPNTPLEETLRALDDLVRQGKVRYIGASNFAAWQLAKAHGISALHGLHRFESLQPEYSLISREIEKEIIPFVQSENVGVIVYSPLGRGILSGKYRAGEAPPVMVSKTVRAADEHSDRVRHPLSYLGQSVPQAASQEELGLPLSSEELPG